MSKLLSCVLAFASMQGNVYATLPSSIPMFQACPDGILQSAATFRGLPRRMRARAVSLRTPAFRSQHHATAVYHAYVKSLPPEQSPPSFKVFHERLEALARCNYSDTCLSFANGMWEQDFHRTRMKLDQTGDFLIVGHDGTVAAFTRLPVGARSLGGVASTTHLALQLSGYAQGKTREYARLTVGEDLGSLEFSHTNLVRHFDKHVLAMSSNLNPRRWRMALKDDKGAQSSFPGMRKRFIEALPADEWKITKAQRVYKRFASEYEGRARAFATSKSVTALSASTRHLYLGAPTVTTVKFDVVTNEVLFANRETNQIITYFRIGDLQPSNHQLQYTFGLPPVQTALEYFLVLALVNHAQRE